MPTRPFLNKNGAFISRPQEDLNGTSKNSKIKARDRDKSGVYFWGK